MHKPNQGGSKAGKRALSMNTPRPLALSRDRQWQLWVLVALGGLLLALALALSAFPAAAKQPVFPDILPLPDGFQPEGIVIGHGTDFYVGSIPTGSIFKGDLRTGEGDVLVPPQPGRNSIGLGFDRRSGYVFAAGGPSGGGYIYDGETGASVASYLFATAPTFVNDVVVTREAAYFTDSQKPVLYRVALGPGGEPASSFTTIQLGGDFDFEPGQFNANGIDATPSGKWLIVVNSFFGALYRVDPETGAAVEIDLGGGSVPNGDGILLDGKTLYVVQNRLNQIAVIRLNHELTEGEIVRTITSPNFQVPTTIDEHGSSLYAVNAKFGVTPAPTEFEVVRVPKR